MIIYCFIGAIGIILVLGAVSRLLWKYANRDLLGEKLTMSINFRLKEWGKKAANLFFYKPEGLAFVGGFSLPLWILIVGLNVLLLAQIFELFFSSGTRVYIPYLGSYDTLSLIIGIIWAMIQVTFEVTRGHSQKSSTRKWLIIALTLAILTEGTLAAVRAYLLTSATSNIAVAPTMWDVVMQKGGPILAGFLGIIIPLGQVLAGTQAVSQFMEPLTIGLFHWIGGLLIFLWCGIAYLICGGKGREEERIKRKENIVHLDPLTSELKKQVEKQASQLEELKKKYENLQKEKDNFNHKPVLYDEIHSKIDEIKNNLDVKNDQWSQDCEILKDKVKTADDPFFLKNKLSIERKALGDKIENEAKSLSVKAENLRKKIVKPEIFKKWQQGALDYNNKLEELKNEVNIFEKKLNDLEERAKGLKSENSRILEIQSNIKTDIKILKEEIKNFLSKIKDLKSVKLLKQLPDEIAERDIKSKIYLLDEDIKIKLKDKKRHLKNIKKLIRKRLKELGVPWYRRLFISFVFVILVIILVNTNSYAKFWEKLKQTPPSTCLIVLVDETGSFGLKQHNGEIAHFWPEIIPWVNRIISILNPGDCFTLIGIDGHGFDTDDVRISQSFISWGAIKAQIDKRKLNQKIKKLKRRQGAKKTDILGALYHAAHLLNILHQSYPNYRGIIVVFSDMQQTAPMDLHNPVRFPQGTRAIFFYVNATGHSQWEQLINKWTSILHSLNLDIQGFYQRGNMEVGFNKLKEILRH